MGGVVLIVLIILGAFIYAVFGVTALFGRTREQQEGLKTVRHRLRQLEEEVRILKESSASLPEAQRDAEAPAAFSQGRLPADSSAGADSGGGLSGAALADSTTAEGIAANTPDTGNVSDAGGSISAATGTSPERPAAISERPWTESPLWNSLKKFVQGGNLWVSGGVILIFIALALLFTYMARRGYITVEMRIAGGALLGLAMTVCGWIFRKKRPVYFLVLQGGGIGILYLCVYAAFRLLPYVSPVLALVLMSLLLPPAIALALLQGSQPLALFGFLGGFAAPLLLSTEAGSHVFLFSYYAFLDLAVFVIVFFTFWRGLSCLAFFSTFTAAIVWVFSSYSPEFFWTVEPFICFYFMLFTLMGIGSGGRKGFSLKYYLDIPAAAGTPLAALILHWRILKDISHGYAWSCIGFGALYLLLTVIIWKKRGKGMRFLAEAYLAASVFLVNLALPLELTTRLTMALWAGEGALLYYQGGRLRDKRVKVSGLIVYAASIIAFGFEDHFVSGAKFLQNPNFSGSLIIAAAALVMALSGRKAQELSGIEEKEASLSFSALLSRILIPWGLIWYFFAWTFELCRVLDDPWPACFIFASLSALIFFFAGRVFRMPLFFLALIPAPASALCYVLWVFFYRLSTAGGLSLWNYNFLQGLGGAAWLCFTLSQALLLYLSGKKTQEENPVKPGLHASWTLACLLSVCAVLSASGRALTVSWNLSPSWTSFAGILPLFVFLVASLSLEGRMKSASFSHRSLFFFVLPLTLFCAAGLWFLVTLFFPGDPRPLPFYLPLLNPLELEQAFCIMALIFWHFKFRSFGPDRDAKELSGKDIPGPSLRLTVILADSMVFLWLNAMLWRSMHFLGGLPWSGIGGADLYHLCLFLLWGIYGIGHIIIGNKKASRPIWIAGAVITVIAVLKLLLIDLAETGTLIRITSFFIAGVLLLVIGWAAPLPPSAKAPEAKEPHRETD
ncbi:MAG: DUF2339 domain-containing protein [Spirochaetaceae bacterium]|jgi:uncharacterized membrane protein|nr:DUF2339 domain-containing protein [Spirochaetaceae bacterium]